MNVLQELEETRVRTTTTIEETDGRLEQEYEARLLAALQEIRSQHEIDLQTVRTELEVLYENKVCYVKTLSEPILCLVYFVLCAAGGWCWCRRWCWAAGLAKSVRDSTEYLRTYGWADHCNTQSAQQPFQ